MSYANYILLVFAVYLIYYTSNIVYDKYIKKGKTKLEEEEQIIDLEEGDQEVSQLVTEESIYAIEREEKEIDNPITTPDDSNDKQEDEQIVDLKERDKEVSPSVTEESVYPIKEEEKEMDNPITTPDDKVEMVVETQGIPLDLLLKEGKSMFEGINF